MSFSVGWASFEEAGGPEAAVFLADRRMYLRKRARARAAAGTTLRGGRAARPEVDAA